eukprot:2820182-Rhodomonas_salina.1
MSAGWSNSRHVPAGWSNSRLVLAGPDPTPRVSTGGQTQKSARWSKSRATALVRLRWSKAPSASHHGSVLRRASHTARARLGHVPSSGSSDSRSPTAH